MAHGAPFRFQMHLIGILRTGSRHTVLLGGRQAKRFPLRIGPLAARPTPATVLAAAATARDAATATARSLR